MRKQLLLAFIFAISGFAASSQYASLDSTFGINALAYDSFTGGPVITSIKVLPNDKIVALGFNTSSPTNHFILARYLPNGTLDSAFGANGWLLDSIPSVNSLTAMTVLMQYDSMIIVTGGYFTNTSPHDTSYLWAMRFKPNGQVDNTFGTSGLAKLSLKGVDGGSNYNPGTGALQPDNKILVGGAVEEGSYSENDFALVRFTANGAVDNTFGSSGRVVTLLIPIDDYNPGGDFLTSIVVEPSGRIVAGGYNWDSYNPMGYTAGQFMSELACYKPNGTLDSSFAGTGLLVFTDLTSGYITSLGLQSDGTIVGVGYNNSPNTYAHLVFVDTTGVIPAYTDDYIGDNSTLSDYFFNQFNTCYITSNNKVLAAGFTGYPGIVDYLNRFQPNGSIDTSFNNYRIENNPRIGAGWAVLSSPAMGVNSLGIQSTGKIIAAGSPYFTLTRIFPGLDTLACSDFAVAITGRSYLCTSSPIDTFKSIMYNVGANPIYQWYKNGAAVGSNSATYITSGLNIGDSIWLSATVTAACSGSQVQVSNVIHILSITAPATVNISASVQYCEYYTFDGQNLSMSGLYIDTAVGLNGCDSITTLHLTVGPRLEDTISATICLGDSFVYDGVSLKQARTYSYLFTSAGGCDSFVTIILKVNGTIDTTSKTICTGSNYNFYGHILTTAGTYRDTLTSVVTGCDSIKTIILSFSNTLSGPIDVQNLCSGSVYHFGGRSLTIPGYYYDTLTALGGCDSIIWLILNISSSINTYLSQTICAGSSYAFGGQTVTAAGTYYDTLTAVGGCDSILTLTLTVTSAPTTSMSHSICAGSSYLFAGHTLTTAGTYRDTLTTSGGCDSIVILTLTVTNALSTPVSYSICAGSSYLFGGQTLTTAGTYHDTLTGSSGCDSIVTLTLSFIPVPNTPLTHSICQGSSYIFGGRTLTSSGTYHDTLTAASGCDSILTLTLTVNSALNTPLSRSICTGSTYIFGGLTLTSSGTYHDTLTAATGCDSILTLTLSVSSVINTSSSHSICAGDSYSFGGQTLTSAGTYRDTLVSSNGCDSVSTLMLSITTALTTAISESICAGSAYSFGGQALTSAGTYSDTLASAMGCDSIVNLTLVVNSLPATPTVTHTGATLTTTATGLQYQWQLNGNNLPGDTMQLLTVTQNGNYTLVVTDQNGCSSISSSVNVTNVGIPDIADQDNNIRLYPNPNKGTFTLQTSNNIGSDYTISDMLGHVIVQKAIRADNETIDLPDAAEGVYTLTVKNVQPLRFVIVR